MKYLFIVPVWGDDYTGLFVNTCLPMLLTPGNLLAFQDEEVKPTLSIVTDLQSYGLMRQASAILEAMKYVDVKFHLIDGLVDTQNPHTAMTACYYMAMRQPEVVPNFTNFVFLTPDSFWSDGAFAYLRQAVAAGKKVVASIGIRVKREFFEYYLGKMAWERPGGRSIPNRKLVSLCLEHMHELAYGHVWGGDKFLANWPSNIYWKVDEHRLISHNFHLHPLLVQCPDRLPKTADTVDGTFIGRANYDYESIDIITSSDQFLGLELSPAGRSWGANVSKPSIAKAQRFAIWHAERLHWFFFKHRIEYVATDEPVDPDLESHISSIISQISAAEAKSKLIERWHLRRPRSFLARARSLILSWPRRQLGRVRRLAVAVRG